MSKFTETLKSVWEKVCNSVDEFFAKDPEIFHLSFDERDALKEEYQLVQQYQVFVGRYGMTGGSFPTNDYQVRKLNGDKLSEEELSSFEAKLNTMRADNDKQGPSQSLDA